MFAFDSRDTKQPFEVKVVDDLQHDPDEKPNARIGRRIVAMNRSKKIAELIGAYQVTTHVEGKAVASVNGRLVNVLWSARRILVITGTVTDAQVEHLRTVFRANDIVAVPRGVDTLAHLTERFGTAPAQPA